MDFSSPGSLWLIAGLAFIAVEAIGISGIGLFFAGLAALCVGVLLEFDVLGSDQLLMQFTLFLLLTGVWTYLLWKPLRRLKMGFSSVEATYVNMIGDTAIVTGSGLSAGSVGDVIWSGTIMKAELEKSAGEVVVTVGSQVIIKEVRGATLIVEPK